MRKLIADCIHYVVHMKRTGEMRHVSEIIELKGFSNGEYDINRVFNQRSPSEMTLTFNHRVRATARKYAPSALLMVGMMAVATSAVAADDSFLNNLGNFICGIATFINTKYLFVVGLIVIVLGAYAYANAESSSRSSSPAPASAWVSRPQHLPS